jgi:glycosyltransferase involved in cell wall biosynthesis
MPLLSVIIPTRNRADRLRGAVASVIRQTLTDLEIVVVDDGSSDETPAVLEEMANEDARVRPIRRRESGGAPAARNEGIRASTGEFLAFLDDDDRWFPNKAEVQIEYLRAHPNVGIASCHHEVVTEADDGGAKRAIKFRGPTRYSSHALLWANFPGGCSFGMVRRSSYSDDLRFDEALSACQDWDFWIRYSKEAAVATVPAVLCLYRWEGPDQLSHPARMVDATARLVEKHSHEMSQSCRAFHAARLRLLAAAGPLQRLGIHAKFLTTLPRDVRWIVFFHMASARAGRLIGDPGFGSRAFVRLVERSR